MVLSGAQKVQAVGDALAYCREIQRSNWKICEIYLNVTWNTRCKTVFKSSTKSQKHSTKAHIAVCQRHSLFMQNTGSIYAFLCVSLFVNLIWTVITWPTFMWKHTIWVASTIGIKSQQRSEFWLMSQSELAVFTLAKAWIFPLLCRLVKTTTATSVSGPVVSFQRKGLYVCVVKESYNTAGKRMLNVTFF